MWTTARTCSGECSSNARPRTSSHGRATRRRPRPSYWSPTTTPRHRLLFHPGLTPLLSRLAPGWYSRQNTSTQTGRLLVLGPALARSGLAPLGLRRLRLAACLEAPRPRRLLADVAHGRRSCPEPTTDLSAVGGAAGRRRAPGEGPCQRVRVLLLSTGSEESFMEGMRASSRATARSSTRRAPASSPSSASGLRGS